MSDRLGLFEGFGVELEYMIVDCETLAVRPIADSLLESAAGEVTTDFEEGPIGWSNELVLHVIELKHNGPVSTLTGSAALFQTEVERINSLLEPFGAMLLPGGMHPTMNPDRETKLWPHENRPIYEAYNRVFDCHGHGWSNLQSTHLNLPFGDDAEFGRLHAAIRALLPLLSALAASSPVADGLVQKSLDYRLDVYSRNQRRIPSILGAIVPEAIWTRADYEQQIFAPMYRDIAKHDPEGILRHEFLNSRGAIARFERDAIEIRVLDIQEAPLQDLAITLLVSETLKLLVAETWSSYADQQALETEPLAALFHQVLQAGEKGVIDYVPLLRGLGIEEASLSAGDVWRRLVPQVFDRLGEESQPARRAIDTILDEGPLARRLLTALGDEPSQLRIGEVWRELADCLRDGRPFHAG